MSFNGYILPMVWQPDFNTPIPQTEWIIPEEFDIEAQYEVIHTVSLINLFLHWLDHF